MMKVPESFCTNCGRTNDAAGQVLDDGEQPEPPSPGDVTVCIGCGHFMVFADDLRTRDPTDEELMKMAGDKRLVAISRALEKLHKQEKK